MYGDPGVRGLTDDGCAYDDEDEAEDMLPNISVGSPNPPLVRLSSDACLSNGPAFATSGSAGGPGE